MYAPRQHISTNGKASCDKCISTGTTPAQFGPGMPAVAVTIRVSRFQQESCVIV